MFTFAIQVPGGDVMPLAIAPTDTVKMLKTAVGVKVGMATFQLYAKHSDRPETPLKRDVDGTTLAEAGLEDGDVLRVKKPSNPWPKARLAQWRVSRGITQVATSLETGFKEVGDKVDAVDGKADEILGILCGKPAPVPEGQSDKEYLKAQRFARDIASANIREVREREDKRIADEKRGRAAKVTLAAEMAEGGVEYIVGGMEGADLQEKWAKHKAQGEILQKAMRKEKREERMALGKATAKPKARGKKRQRGDPCQTLLSSPNDQDQKEEAFDIQEEMAKAIDDFAAAQIVQDAQLP